MIINIEDVPIQYRPHIEKKLSLKDGYLYGRLRYYTADGHSHQKWIATHMKARSNIKAAKEYCQQWLEEHWREYVPDFEETVDPHELLFLDAYAQWLDRLTLDPNTIRNYRGVLKNHLVNFFPADLALKDVTAGLINSFYDYLLESTDLSPNTIRHYHSYLSSFFTYAAKRDMIDYTRNPMQRADPPEAEEYEAQAFTAEQLLRLMEGIHHHQLETPVIIGIHTGMRRSEVLGLKWENIDFDTRTIRVKHTIKREQCGIVGRDKTKTKKSIREIIISSTLKEYLRNLIAHQAEMKKLCGNCYIHDYDEYVCVNDIGDIIKPDHLTKSFDKICAKCNIPKLNFHSLRHSFATLFAQNGGDINKLGKWLGHGDMRTTMKYYIHLDRSDMEDVQSVMANILSPTNNKTE